MKTYPLSDEDSARLERDFKYHAPRDDQPERYGAIRGEASRMAATVMTLCPPSRERSRALTKIEEAVMWANAAIARNE